jgi:hypothetical protein
MGTVMGRRDIIVHVNATAALEHNQPTINMPQVIMGRRMVLLQQTVVVPHCISLLNQDLTVAVVH